jgi:hypothetical protein
MTAAGPQGPLAAVLEARGAIAFDVVADHSTGLVAISPRLWPWLKLLVAPETGLEFAQRLVGAVADLTRGPTRS